MAQRNLGSKYFEAQDVIAVLDQLGDQELCPVCGMKFGTKKTVTIKEYGKTQEERVHARLRCQKNYKPDAVGLVISD